MAQIQLARDHVRHVCIVFGRPALWFGVAMLRKATEEEKNCLPVVVALQWVIIVQVVQACVNSERVLQGCQAMLIYRPLRFGKGSGWLCVDWTLVVEKSSE